MHSNDLVLRALLDALAATRGWVWKPIASHDTVLEVTLALVDLDESDGLAAVSRVRAQLGPTIPVIAVGRPALEEIEALLASGADDVLLRPFTADTLVTSAVLAAARGRAVAAASLPPPTRDDYHAVVDALGYPVLVVRDERLIYANPALAELLGYADQSALIGLGLEDLLHPDELDEARQRLERAQSGQGTVAGTERRALRADGESIILALSPLRRVLLGGAPAVVTVARDVTEERLVEARLRLADRLTSVGTLAAGVAHEVNNPLASVVANLSVLEEELPELAADRDPEERQELMEILADAREGADRVHQIVRDLSTFAKVDSTTLGPVDVNHNLEATINIAMPQIRHRARVVRDLQSVPAVRGNEARLGQVFLHLVLNAVQAMPAGRISENELRVRTRGEGSSWVVIEVEDTGRGMPEEELRRIFEPFFTTKPVGEGIGLGLAISHSIVEQMGGQIEVSSELGQGTCFTIRLPAAARERRTTADTLPFHLSSATSAEILVVDDEPMITRSLQRLLKGHAVTVARSGREALTILQGRSFDLIICDLNMPDLTGIDVFESLQRLRPGDEERIVFITGGAFTPETATFLDSVPNIWFEKPFDFKAVRALLDIELGRRG